MMLHPKTVSRSIAVSLVAAGAIGVIGLSATPTPHATPHAQATQRAFAAAPVAPPKLVAVAAPAPLPIAAQPAPISTPVNEPYVIKRALEINEPIIHGFWKWDDAGVPDGPVLITVDTVAQTISVFRAGYEIGVAVVLYGANSKPTPNGVFPILGKDKNHVSNLYNAPMPYMLRLTNDGISIHASDVAEGRATHGCVGVPKEFAKRLFAQAKIGDRVIVTSGQRLQVSGGV
jgi:L,D-transpeptidase catalytic domain